MNCPACGAERARGAAFCGSCGRPFGDYSVGSPAPVAPRPAAAPSAAVTTRVAPAYAGFWLRFVAHLIDGFIVLFGAIVLALLILAVVGFKFFRTFGEAGKEPDAATTAAFIAILIGYFVLLVVGQWLDYAWMESSAKQATLGKLAVGLVVTDTEGRRISFGRASGRFFAKIITGFIPFAIGYIMAGFTEKKQALHDMIASCLVVKK